LLFLGQTKLLFLFGKLNGESAKKRALKNQSQARWRASKAGSDHSKFDDSDVDGSVDSSRSTTVSTREEKRRGKQKKEPTDVPASNPKDKTITPKVVRSKGVWPEGFALDDDLKAYAVEKLPAGVDVGRLWEQFEAHHRKTGSEFKDWRQAWRTWVLNAEGFGKLPMLKTASGSDSGFIARAAEAKRRWVTPEIGATAGERTSVDTQASPDSPEPLDGSVIGSTVNQQSLMEPF
jgi:hypothetical protein